MDRGIAGEVSAGDANGAATVGRRESHGLRARAPTGRGAPPRDQERVRERGSADHADDEDPGAASGIARRGRGWRQQQRGVRHLRPADDLGAVRLFGEGPADRPADRGAPVRRAGRHRRGAGVRTCDRVAYPEATAFLRVGAEGPVVARGSSRAAGPMEDQMSKKRAAIVVKLTTAVLLIAAAALAQGDDYKARLSPVPVTSARSGITGLGTATATLTGRRLVVRGTFEGMQTPV